MIHNFAAVPPDVWYAFLRCWTASVGTPGYTKTDFITVERFLLLDNVTLDTGRAAFQRCQGKFILHPDYKAADWFRVEEFIYAQPYLSMEN